MIISAHLKIGHPVVRNLYVDLERRADRVEAQSVHLGGGLAGRGVGGGGI